MFSVQRSSVRRSRPWQFRVRRLALETLEDRALPSASWSGYAHDPQHTGLSDVASQSLSVIRWQTEVDLNPQISGGDLLSHYGSPLTTQANTVILPVKTGAQNGFRIEGHSGIDGSLLWTVPTDYVLPPHGWIPSYSPTFTSGNRLYFAGIGGTVYYLDNPDQGGATTTGQLAFYGINNYSHSLDNAVYINTPITSDTAGDIFFGFVVTRSNPLNLTGGIARIGADGTGTWVAASTAAGDANIREVVMNCAPAVSNDGGTIYVAVSRGSSGYLLALNSTTLATRGKVALNDPNTGALAFLLDDGTASPTVGPDGDVYYGVLENHIPDHHDRGWLLHFSADLSQSKIPGSFGWDDTATVVPSSMVPSYHGPSDYLLMTKYNNYAGDGGDGHNAIAIIDPNTPMADHIRPNVMVMNEVLTHLGVTPDPDFPDKPGAVREWCINSAAVDPYTDSVLANSEDGHLYRWDLSTNTFTESMSLHTEIGEAYTPTVIGTNGAVYAINGATLYALQSPAGPVVLSAAASSNFAPVASVRLTFSVPIDPATFTRAQVTSFFGPAGPVQVTGVNPVAGSNDTQFDIAFASQGALGNYTFVLSPSIQDQSGNGLDTNDDGIPGEYPADQYVGHFTIQGPKIIANTPTANVYAPFGSLRVTFNEPMNPATFTPAQVFFFSGPRGPVAVTAVAPVAGSNNTQFDLQFPAQTVTGVYQMLIGPNIRDMAGHQMDQDGNFVEGEIPGDLYYLRFGIRGPRIVASTPNFALFAPFTTARVTFDESMDPTTFTTGQVQFTDPHGNTIPVTGITPVTTTNNMQFDVSFGAQTELGRYTMVIGPHIRDTFGNEMDQNQNLITGETPGDQYMTSFNVVSTTIGPDGFGYTATVHRFKDFDILNRRNTFTIIDAANDVSVPVDLGSNTVSFYGVSYTGNNQLYVSSNGLITFGAANSSPFNSNLTMSPVQPAIAVLWADWIKSSGDPTGPMVVGRFDHYDANGVPHRLVIEWNQVHHNGGSQGTLTFQAYLELNPGHGASHVTLNYLNLQSGDSWAEGNNATVGIKDAGTQGSRRLLVTSSGRSPFVGTGQAILISVPPTDVPTKEDLIDLVSATLVPVANPVAAVPVAILPTPGVRARRLAPAPEGHTADLASTPGISRKDAKTQRSQDGKGLVWEVVYHAGDTILDQGGVEIDQ
jgi:hypothetical protein